VRELHLVEAREQLQRPLPLRSDLREALFDTPVQFSQPNRWNQAG
jgi:hypothetical protein